MPLPFWTVGGLQVLGGRSLLAARLTGLGLGLAQLPQFEGVGVVVSGT